MNKTKNKNIYYFIYFVVLFIFLCVFYSCMKYELHHEYTADAPLYWAVGRGMLNGITPYSGLYENKPLGIFVLSAIVFLFSDDTILFNIFMLFVLAIIAIVPVLIVKKYSRENNSDSFLSCLITFLISMLLMSYCEGRSGGFQVEAIGAAFSLLCIWSIVRLKYSTTKKQRIFSFITTIIFMQLVVLMKEPFILIVVAGSLLFIDNIKDFIKCIVIPGIISGLIYLFILFCFKLLIPYFNIYFFHMFNTRIVGKKLSIINVNYIYGDLYKFIFILPFIIILFLVLTIIGIKYYKEKRLKVYHALRIVLIILTTSFCVGMGGQYYNHHFVFAVPIYVCLIVYGCIILNKISKNNNIVKHIIPSFIILLVLINIANISRVYGKDYTKKYLKMKRRAEYVDKLLDYYGEDRYQFIGFNGEDVFYGLTKHSPEGPVFVQDPDNFKINNNWFSKKIEKQLSNSNIVIVKKITSSSMKNKIEEILENDFTTIPPKDGLKEISDFKYIVYYRKGRW